MCYKMKALYLYFLYFKNDKKEVFLFALSTFLLVAAQVKNAITSPNEQLKYTEARRRQMLRESAKEISFSYLCWLLRQSLTPQPQPQKPGRGQQTSCKAVSNCGKCLFAMLNYTVWCTNFID